MIMIIIMIQRLTDAAYVVCRAAQEDLPGDHSSEATGRPARS